MWNGITYTKEEGFFVISARGKKNANEMEIVLLSRSIPFSTRWAPMGKSFYIPESFESMAKAEIDNYLIENADWRPNEIRAVETFYSFSYINLLVVAALSFFHWYSNETAVRFGWLENGLLSSELTRNGQWLRTVTALCLHADGTHLLSNVVGLMIFLAGTANLIGVGISWLLVLVAGALGNLASAMLSGIGYKAIGASTAVFAAVGILGALGARRYLNDKRARNRFFIPLIASLGLFAMLGTSPKTDVVAHLLGLLMGTIVGLAFSPLLRHRILGSRVFQTLSFLIFAGIIVGSWWWRLRG